MQNQEMKSFKNLELFYVSYDALLDYPIKLPVGNTKAGRATNVYDAFRAEKRCLNGLQLKALFIVGAKGAESAKESKKLERKLQEVFSNENRSHSDTGNAGENYFIKSETIIEWLESNTNLTRVF